VATDVLAGVPARRGHFVLESGYHTNVWLSLDALFVDPAAVAPHVAALADQLRPHAPTAVCGPLLGGAFLAQALATQMGLRFYVAQPAPSIADGSLFSAVYDLPADQRHRITGERVALVDEVISAGSSVRATDAALTGAGATTVVVGSLLVLGDRAVEHFAARGVPLVALARQAFTLWPPTACPLCAAGTLLEDPTRG